MLELEEATGVLELGVADADEELELELLEDPDDEPDEEPDDFEPEPLDPLSGSVYC